MKMLFILVLVASSFASVVCSLLWQERVGDLCCDAELRNVNALGCGDYATSDWLGCTASNPAWQLSCHYRSIPFQGTVCTGAEMCPLQGCSGAPNSYCTAGWTHSGTHCSTATVYPCCIMTMQCNTQYIPGDWPSFNCGCSPIGAFAMGSRTVATAGGSCTGTGPSPTPVTEVLDPL
jgi:hypothetical protein